MLGSLESFQLTQRRPRMIAPQPVCPRGECSAARALLALAESRQGLLAAVLALDGLALGEITHPHPLLGPLNLYQWGALRRAARGPHTAQIQEIASQLAGT
jgi:hypothetical protein